MNNDLICVDNWKKLHSNRYFFNHPHYIGLTLVNDSSFIGLLKKFIDIDISHDVLEIGCGYGRLMNDVADNVKSITGIDISHEVLEITKNLVCDRKKNAFVKFNDGISIPFGDDTFDIVYSFSVFQHITKHMVYIYLKEIDRILRYNGVMFIQFLSSPLGEKEINVKKVTEQSVGWTKEEIFDACLGLDFKNISVEKSVIDSKYGIFLIGKK